MPSYADGEAKQPSSSDTNELVGLDQVDWGGEAGKFYECWKTNPCCGAPHPMKMLCCLFCWSCCNPCSLSKLYASSVDQECALLLHFLMACCFPFITMTLVRTNLRNRLGVQGNIIGDCVCVFCCGGCSQCQTMRAVPTEEWNLLEPAWKSPETSAPEFIFLR